MTKPEISEQLHVMEAAAAVISRTKLRVSGLPKAREENGRYLQWKDTKPKERLAG